MTNKEPEQMVRCPKWQECKSANHPKNVCPHKKEHNRHDGCVGIKDVCPACVPVEPAPKEETSKERTERRAANRRINTILKKSGLNADSGLSVRGCYNEPIDLTNAQRYVEPEPQIENPELPLDETVCKKFCIVGMDCIPDKCGMVAQRDADQKVFDAYKKVMAMPSVEQIAELVANYPTGQKSAIEVAQAIRNLFIGQAH